MILDYSGTAFVQRFYLFSHLGPLKNCVQWSLAVLRLYLFSDSGPFCYLYLFRDLDHTGTVFVQWSWTILVLYLIYSVTMGNSKTVFVHWFCPFWDMILFLDTKLFKDCVCLVILSHLRTALQSWIIQKLCLFFDLGPFEDCSMIRDHTMTVCSAIFSHSGTVFHHWSWAIQELCFFHWSWAIPNATLVQCFWPIQWWIFTYPGNSRTVFVQWSWTILRLFIQLTRTSLGPVRTVYVQCRLAFPWICFNAWLSC